MNPTTTKPWGLPEIRAAVDNAPLLPPEAVEICRRIFAPCTEELYEMRRAEQAKKQVARDAT